MKNIRKNALFLWPVCTAVALALTGCSGTVTPAATPVSADAKSAVQLRLGDAPLDRVLAFELTVSSVTLTDASGTTTSILKSPTEVELTHLAGTFEPLSFESVPQGTYTRATIIIGSPDLTYIDPGTGLIVETHPALATNTATIPFPSGGIAVGSGPTSLNFDFNLASSLAFDASNNVTVTPVFTVSAVTVPSSSQEQDTDNGEVEDVSGPVVSTTVSTLVISSEESGIQLSFATDVHTSYEGVSGLSSIKSGEIVKIDASTNTDGSFLAKKIEIEDDQTNGLEAQGIVTSVVGVPAVSFKVLVQDEASSAPSSSQPALGTEVAVMVSGSTTYGANVDHAEMDGLPFAPVFDGNTLAPAQRVETDADSPNATALVAKKVRLQQQSLFGIVSAYAVSNGRGSFTLTLPTDSIFAKLTHLTTVTVYQQPKSKLKNTPSVNNGDSLRVRGLLFLDGTQYRLVASHLNKP